MHKGYSISPVGGAPPEFYEIKIGSAEVLAKITGIRGNDIFESPVRSCGAAYDPVGRTIEPEFEFKADYYDGLIERAIYAKFCQEAEEEIRSDYEGRFGSRLLSPEDVIELLKAATNFKDKRKVPRR